MGWFATKQEKLDQALIDASYDYSDGSLEKVRDLIAQGANVHVKDYSNTLLYRMVERGSLETAKLLVEQKVDVAARDCYGRTLLMAARGPKMIDYLCQLGLDVNAKDESGGATPLHCAAVRGDFPGVKKLLEKGADVNATDKQGNRPADVAKKNEHYGIAEFLQEHARSLAQAAAVTPVSTGWILSAPDEVIFSEKKEGAGYCLTSIFNFNARIYTQIARNLATGAESQSIRFFDEFPDKTLLEAAFGQLRQLGGNTQGISIHGTVLDKGGPG